MLPRDGEDKQRSGLARSSSSRLMLHDFFFAVVYLHVSRIYASNKVRGFLEIEVFCKTYDVPFISNVRHSRVRGCLK